MAWRAALTRDAEYVTVGDDVSANEAGVDFTNYTEEENEPAYDSNSEEDTDRSQQHTSRHPNRDGAMSAGSNRTRPTVTSASGTRPNSRGAKSRPASSKSRPMSKGSKYSHLRPGSGGIGVDEQDQILLQGTGHDIALHLLPSRPGVSSAGCFSLSVAWLMMACFVRRLDKHCTAIGAPRSSGRISRG